MTPEIEKPELTTMLASVRKSRHYFEQNKKTSELLNGFNR
jgi:hypothetical protein